MHDPAEVARNMIATRGVQPALDRCDRYISGAIKSENSKDFWQRVKDAISATNFN